MTRRKSTRRRNMAIKRRAGKRRRRREEEQEAALPPPPPLRPAAAVMRYSRSSGSRSHWTRVTNHCGKNTKQVERAELVLKQPRLLLLPVEPVPQTAAQVKVPPA